MYLIVKNHSGDLTVILFIWSRSRNSCTRPASNILLRRLEQLPAQRVKVCRCGLIDGTATQGQQIALLWQAVEKLACQIDPDCVPAQAERESHFEADRLNDLVGK